MKQDNEGAGGTPEVGAEVAEAHDVAAQIYEDLLSEVAALGWVLPEGAGK